MLKFSGLAARAVFAMPRSPRIWALLLLAVALAVSQFSGCGEKDHAPFLTMDGLEGEVPRERLPTPTSAFRERDCWRDVSNYVEQCGTVSVAEAEGSAAVLEIGVVRVFSRAKDPAPDPVVYLDGGPGNATAAQIDLVFPHFAELAEDRDVIFIDQRGTGVTEPPMTCKSATELPDCFAAIAEVTDPAAYTSKNNAKDIDLVRQALGYDEWNLLGISYGTRLGLTLLRDHPAGVRSVILDSVVPLEVDLYGEAATNGEASFEKTFAACAADAACAEKYPDSMAQLLGLVKTLNEEPLRACGDEFSGDQIVNILFNLLYSPVAVGFVPRIVDDLAEGDSTLFEDAACDLGRVNFSLPMHLSIQCAEEAAFTSQETIAELDAEVRPELVPGLSGSSFLPVCTEWPVPKAPALENQPVQSSLPTLVLSGFFDPITPPSYGEQVDQTLSASQYFLIQNESHGASLSACGLALMRAFLKAPGEPVQASCLSDLPPPTFESLRATAERRVVGQRTKFLTEAPTDEQIAAAREDLERRLRL